MCGIAGYSSLTEVLNRESFRSNLQTILHDAIALRGPDHQGTWSSSQSIALHSRLGIQDIHNPQANQPFVSDSYILCFNGEIYNHYSLRSQYLPDHQFQTTSDTETLFCLLAKYGIHFVVPLLNGIFAFSWLDRTLNTLYLCRDHLGIKPLFYSQDVDNRPCLIYCSHASGIALSSSSRFKLSEEGLISFFHLGAPHNDLTLFSDIKSVPISSFLQYDISTNHLTCHSYQPNYSSSSFDHVLSSESISDCPTACLLSGGVDSSVLNLALKPEYSVHLDSTEKQFARHISQLSNSDCLIVPQPEFEPDRALAFYARVTGHCSASAPIPMLAAESISKRNIRVAFSANGADELFYGYPRTPPPKVFSELYSSEYFSNYFSSPHFEAINLSYDAQRRHIFRSFDVLKPLIMGSKCDIAPPDHSNFQVGCSDSWLPRHYELMTYVVSDLNVTLDHASMLYSIEARVPFLNSDLIHLAKSLTWDHCVSRDVGRKSLLKSRLMNSGVSNSLWMRPKLGFSLSRKAVNMRRKSTSSKLKAIQEFFSCPLNLNTRDGLYLESSVHAFHAWKSEWLDKGLVTI